MPTELTSKNYDQYLNKQSNCLIYFFAKWCYHSKEMKPNFEETEKYINENTNTQITFLCLNIGAEKNIAEKYNIIGTPTVVLIKNGSVVQIIIGQQTIEQLLLMIGKHFDVSNKNNQGDFVEDIKENKLKSFCNACNLL